VTALPQLSLDDAIAENRLGATRTTDPETSRAAAVVNLPNSGAQRRAVFEELRRAGGDGRTDYELGFALDILRTSAGKRRKELVEQGLVEATDERRETDTGSRAIVWRLTEKGWAAA
jgi:predicted ArsR family transcriptional regulator